MSERLLITGAGGFIGGHLVANLLREGNEVRAVDIKPLQEWYQLFPEAENLQLDLCGKDACERAVRDVSLIYNLAADMGGMGFIENNKALCMLSVLVNTHMLMMAKEAGVSRFFYSSSACVYAADKQTDPNVTALKEEDAYPAMPEDGYGWKIIFRTNVPALSRRLRVGNPRCALSQRLWATGNLCWWPGEGTGGDLPQSN